MRAGCILASETERHQDNLLSRSATQCGSGDFVGLGCEYLEAQMMSELIAPEKPAAYVRIQDMSSSMAATRKAEDLVEEMLALLRQDRRLEVGPEALVLGAKCGCSDWTSGVASNPPSVMHRT
jgi:altronate dehydratase